MRYEFLSDNSAAMCPEATAALLEHNGGFAPGYGADAVSRRAADAIRALLDADADVHFVASGTAANAIACAALCRPFETVLAHEHAHIRTHEAGAPSFFGNGLRLAGIPGANAKIDLGLLRVAVAEADTPQRQCVAALSITNSSEYGTLYTDAELTALCSAASAGGLRVHVDGARLANAVAAGLNPRVLAGAGVDILVMGGSKAGASLSEALVVFDKQIARRFDTRLKQNGQLCSKGRFLAAPWLGLLGDGTHANLPWIKHAAHANAMARKLAALMPFRIVHPVETNCVFTEMDEARLVELVRMGWKVGRFPSGAVRFVCSWAVTDAMVEELGATLRQLA